MNKDPIDLGWTMFLEWAAAAQEDGQLDEFFRFFLTPDEHESLASRTLIVHDLLKKDKPQRQIAQDNRVSIAKITRGSNELKRIGARLRDFLQSMVI